MVNPEFLSGEASASPAVEPLLAGAKMLSERGFVAGALAARNGLRMTTHAGVPFGMLTPQDFVEVADYDAHLDRIMCIGRRDPHPLAGMLALILRAKKEIGAMALVEAQGAGRGAQGAAAFPIARPGRTQLERAMGALEALRGPRRVDAAASGPLAAATGNDAIQVGNHVLVVGRTPEEAIRRALQVLSG